MSLDAFRDRLTASREKWVNVGESREILMRRPAYAVQCDLRDKAAGDESYMLALLLACAKDWRGFTLDYLLPGEAADTLPFDSEWMQSVLDDKTLRAPIVAAFVEFWAGANQAREQTEKN